LTGHPVCKCRVVTVDPNNARFSIDWDFLVDNVEKRLIQYIGEPCWVCISRDIEVLGSWCFFGCESIPGITFDHDSRLRRIEEACFYQCSLESIVIPRNVEFVQESAFVGCLMQLITVSEDKARFSINRDFLIDNIESRLIRYVGKSKEIHFWKDIEILGESCFAGDSHKMNAFRRIMFDHESRLMQIDEYCFSIVALNRFVFLKVLESWANHAFLTREFGHLDSRTNLDWCELKHDAFAIHRWHRFAFLEMLKFVRSRTLQGQNFNQSHLSETHN
jgi:hypothetical protein